MATTENIPESDPAIHELHVISPVLTIPGMHLASRVATVLSVLLHACQYMYMQSWSSLLTYPVHCHDIIVTSHKVVVKIHDHASHYGKKTQKVQIPCKSISQGWWED